MSITRRDAEAVADSMQIIDERLHSELHLVLQTRQAQLLVRGRLVKDKPVIAGLLVFADKLRLISQAAEEDDPFADWWLVKIHDGLSVAETRIERETRQLKLQLRSTRSMQIAPAEVKEPFRMALRFASPFAYRASRMLGAFDELTCCAFTAQRIGLIHRDRCHLIVRSCARRIRAAFNMPLTYRRLGITRGTSMESQPSFRRAQDLMGDLPKDILSGERRAPLAPTIRGVNARSIPPVTSTGENDDMVFE